METMMLDQELVPVIKVGLLLTVPSNVIQIAIMVVLIIMQTNVMSVMETKREINVIVA